jgi:NAD(P)-dependent dehydrogenase (short-subunit alcohol dehydrogenase family)
MKTALITGATSRLGVCLSRFFARENFKLLLHVHSARDAARDLAHSLARDGAEVEVFAADFTDAADIARFCAEIAGRGGADVIVNNASLFRHDFPGRGDAALLAASLSVHVTAPFLIVEAAAAAKKPEALLTVFNILDQKLLNPNPDYYSYTLGKSALLSLTELWQKAGRTDVRMFGLLPGLMFPSGDQTTERFALDERKIPTGHATPAAHICALMGFYLAHPGLAGETVPIDGGEHLVPRLRDVAFE